MKIIILLTALFSVTLTSGCSQLLDRMADRAASEAMVFRQDLFQPDEINIVLCGTNAPMPNPERAEACTAVFVGGEMLLFDAGDGAFSSIAQLKLPIDKLSQVFVTHLHDDHIVEVGHVIHRSWMWGRKNNVQVYGPKGTINVMDGLNKMYEADRQYRFDHHGKDVLDPQYSIPTAHDIAMGDQPELKTVYQNGELKVSAFLVDHGPIKPAFGYRIDYKGKVVVISGDTTEKGLPTSYIKYADVLISEVMNMKLVATISDRMKAHNKNRLGTITHDIQNYHIGTKELGELAQKAYVKTLILTHLVPGAINFQPLNNWLFKSPISEHYDGEIIVGVDGTEYSLKIN